MAVMKKKVMKKNAAKKQKLEKQIEESEDDSVDEEASGEDDGQESSEEQEKKEAPKSGKDPASVKKAANDAKRGVRSVQCVIDRLLRQQKELARKMKENKEALRKAEKEIEPLKAILASKRRVVNKLKNDKLQAIEERKAASQARFRKANAKRMKAAQKRLAAANSTIRGVKGKAEDAKTALSRAQSKVDEFNRTIKELKAKGERVPDDFKDDFSSPHAWKPPGYIAAKGLAAAKEVLAKAQAVYKKAYGEFEAKDLKRKATVDMMEEVKAKRKAGPGTKIEAASPVTSKPETKAMKSSSTGKKKQKGTK